MVKKIKKYASRLAADYGKVQICPWVSPESAALVRGHNDGTQGSAGRWVDAAIKLAHSKGLKTPPRA